MLTDRNLILCLLGIFLGLESACGVEHAKADSALLTIDNGTIKIGIDGDKGGAITWLSSRAYEKNMVNIADPGRLIQQSYYAGKRLDRTSTGQSPNWSPWSWNPIQGGGMGSWAKASQSDQVDGTLFSEVTPKLWDMPDEEAQATMQQWTTFEALAPNAVVVKCEFVSLRNENDRWGGAIVNPQEVPACYFTRNFATVKSYLGGGQWRQESQEFGPPWGKAIPPRKSMACFDAAGHGVAIFSPSSTEPWNFGPHGGGLSDDPTGSPCMHVAPIDRVKLGPRSTYRYRYWIVVGDESDIEASLDSLWRKYANERAEVTPPRIARPEVNQP